MALTSVSEGPPLNGKEFIAGRLNGKEFIAGSWMKNGALCSCHGTWRNSTIHNVLLPDSPKS